MLCLISRISRIVASAFGPDQQRHRVYGERQLSECVSGCCCRCHRTVLQLLAQSLPGVHICNGNTASIHHGESREVAAQLEHSWRGLARGAVQPDEVVLKVFGQLGQGIELEASVESLKDSGAATKCVRGQPSHPRGTSSLSMPSTPHDV